jgi:DNA-binding MarR family transcriptional regulator
VRKPRWLSPIEQHAWRAFLQATLQLQAQLDHELERDAGMPFAYFQILVMLSDAHERTMRMSDLAERTWSSRSRLSHAVDRLEERGWVHRTSCPTDKRGAFAVLTDAGFAELAAAAPKHLDSVRRHVFDRLTPEQVGQLADISSRIADLSAVSASSRVVGSSPRSGGHSVVTADLGTSVQLLRQLLRRETR